MAKKSVASQKTGEEKNYTKVVKVMKSKKTNGYVFKEKIVANDKVDEYLKQE